MSTSDESGKILLPEGSSICQYRPDISAIIVSKQSRTRLLLAHPVSVHFKNKKAYCRFWKQSFQNQPKSVIGNVRQLALSPQVGQAMQLEWYNKYNTSAVYSRVARINNTTQQHK